MKKLWAFSLLVNRDFGPENVYTLDGHRIQRDCSSGMIPRICICCGEPMTVGGNVLSRNPNICASCSSIMDGMDESEEDEKSTEEQRGLRAEESEEAQYSAQGMPVPLR
jgi:hypothetical protein